MNNNKLKLAFKIVFLLIRSMKKNEIKCSKSIKTMKNY